MAILRLRTVMQNQPASDAYGRCPWMPRDRLLALLDAGAGAGARIIRRLVADGVLEARGAAGALEYRWPVDSISATSTDAHPTSPRRDAGPADRPPPESPPP